MPTFSLTEDEIKQAASLLSKLQPGYLPQRLFDEINRLHVTSTVVVVPFVRMPQGLHVLLIQRGTGPNDPVWPGHWHLPGTMLRPTDKPGDYTDAFARIFDGELAGARRAGEPSPLKTAFTQTKRGHELTPLYFVELVEAPRVGRLFPVDALPSPIIEHEPAYIRAAAQRFSATRPA
jgi:hypothetical protein